VDIKQYCNCPKFGATKTSYRHRSEGRGPPPLRSDNSDKIARLSGAIRASLATLTWRILVLLFQERRCAHRAELVLPAQPGSRGCDGSIKCTHPCHTPSSVLRRPPAALGPACSQEAAKKWKFCDVDTALEERLNDLVARIAVAEEAGPLHC
jgi:hypothetical protein